MFINYIDCIYNLCLIETYKFIWKNICIQYRNIQLNVTSIYKKSSQFKIIIITITLINSLNIDINTQQLLQKFYKFTNKILNMENM